VKKVVEQLRGHPLIKKGEALIRQREGPLTQELVLHPSDFGLGKIPARLLPDDTTTMVCGFCATGCGLNIHLRDGEAINLTADTNYTVNLGMACPKGWEALTPLRAKDRAGAPMLRNEKTGELEATDWERALIIFCERLKEIKKQYGSESVAFLSTGQIVTEEMAFLGTLFKFGMGFVHCDSNTRQCMATSHVAYKQAFGFDAPPYTYADFEESDVLVFIGSNLCISHPIMWQRVMRNKNNPEIIVVDPRKTETAMAATQHYAIKPKSDLVLLYGLANILISSGWIKREFIDAHTTGFDQFGEFVRQFTTDRVMAETGLDCCEIWKFAESIAHGKCVSFWWTMGVNQGHEATRTAQAIINLALMTGNIGRPGTGANSVTGQCNAMGSRVYGNITSLLGGHDARNDAHRTKIAAILGIEESTIPRQDSWAYDQIVQGIRDGKIKALWVVATNSSHSWVQQQEFNQLLNKLEFLVVQDMYFTTETAQHADLVLPAAGWGEKEGTFINSERRIGLVKKVARAPGQALSDFNIFKLIAQYWGCGGMFTKWTSPESAFDLIKAASRGQPCDITGIGDYGMIDECGGVQWPWPEQAEAVYSPNWHPERNEGSLDISLLAQVITFIVPGNSERSFAVAQDDNNKTSANSNDFSQPPKERRLFEDGRFFTSDGRAKFLFEQPRSMPEPVCEEFPLLLMTGRGTSSQWHTQTRTAKSDVLRKLYPADVYVEINPADAERLAIVSGRQVRVNSRRGEITASAFVTTTVPTGSVFMPMHYAETNQLTFAAFDPYSRQPSYKACAVAIRAIGKA
jgi:anaerobic selenocysteine-containing dehydrogenase